MKNLSTKLNALCLVLICCFMFSCGDVLQETIADTELENESGVALVKGENNDKPTPDCPYRDKIYGDGNAQPESISDPTCLGFDIAYNIFNETNCPLNATSDSDCKCTFSVKLKLSTAVDDVYIRCANGNYSSVALTAQTGGGFKSTMEMTTGSKVYIKYNQSQVPEVGGIGICTIDNIDAPDDPGSILDGTDASGMCGTDAVDDCDGSTGDEISNPFRP